MDITRNVHIQSEAARSLLANIRDVIGEDEEMWLTAIEGETDLMKAITDAVDRIYQLSVHSDVLAARIKTLSERKGRFEDQAERIKAALLVAMGHAELRKIELPIATLSVRAVPAKVEITDEASVPSKYWKPQDPKLDKKAILDALKSEEIVPGAVLSNGGETIAVRYF